MTNNNIYFIANWKMYGDLSSLNSIKKVISLKKQKKFKKAKIVYCPPNIIVNEFIKYTKYTNISVGSILDSVINFKNISYFLYLFLPFRIQIL